MALNSIHVSVPTEKVFEVLEDPFAYPRWVVGTSQVTDADEDWPDEGARFSWRAGPAPFSAAGQTEVIEADPPRRLVLCTGLPIGDVTIAIELHEEGDGTRITLNETLQTPLARTLADAAFHLRNSQTLAQLKALVLERAQHVSRIDQLTALTPGPHWLDLPQYAELVDRVERCYLAVTTKHGPHVTPTAFTSSSGRVWILANRASLKVRMLLRDPRASVLIRADERSVVLWGEATILDPARSWRPEHLIERAFALPALARYVVSNKERVGGYLSGSLSALPELDPTARVLISIAPNRMVLLDGDEIEDQRGRGIEHPTRVRRKGKSAGKRGPELDLDDIPESIAAIAEGNRVPAALGWTSLDGPSALPAHWHQRSDLASVPAVLLDDITEGPVALSMDTDEGSDLDDQKGLMVRGTGRVVGRNGGHAAIAVDQDRTTVWEGVRTETVQT